MPAGVLGLLDKEMVPTERARRLWAIRENKEAQLALVASWFEESSVATKWMHWAGVEQLSDLEPESAVQFLLAQSRELGKTTNKRRAGTLASWLRTLQAHLPPNETARGQLKLPVADT